MSEDLDAAAIELQIQITARFREIADKEAVLETLREELSTILAERYNARPLKVEVVIVPAVPAPKVRRRLIGWASLLKK